MQRTLLKSKIHRATVTDADVHYVGSITIDRDLMDAADLVEYEQVAVVDVDESESAENFELPGADLSGEELSVRVIPKQADEFTCSSCFLVHHRSRLASEKNGRMICTDCAA